MVQSHVSISIETKLHDFSGKYLNFGVFTVESEGLKAVPWVIDIDASDHIVCTLDLYTKNIVNIASTVGL